MIIIHLYFLLFWNEKKNIYNNIICYHAVRLFNALVYNKDKI
jgi:hypothetical protein